MTKVFEPQGMSVGLKMQLNAFMARWDFRYLYKLYNWGLDNHTAGFPDILKLEKQLVASAKAKGITLVDIQEVARWGGNDRNLTRIRTLRNPSLPGDMLYNSNGTHISSLRSDPIHPVKELDKNSEQVGPTYLSKVLRFALPDQYGAIDTRCALVFENWVQFTINNRHNNPSIAKDGKWWRGYPLWINILRYFARNLPANCPHPKGFVSAGLRNGKTWTCADVEMALFSYASHVINNPNSLEFLKCLVPSTDDDDFDSLE